MPAFTDEQYRFVVERLAEGKTHTAVAILVNSEWKGAKFTARDVSALDRDKLNADWRAYFEACRAAFKAGAPTSDVEFRIALLDEMAREAASRNAFELALKLLELIEKIQSGFFAGKASTGGGVPNDPLAVGGTIVVEHVIVDAPVQGQQSDPAGVRPAAPAETV